MMKLSLVTALIGLAYMAAEDVSPLEIALGRLMARHCPDAAGDDYWAALPAFVDAETAADYLRGLHAGKGG